jgi:RNA polymerase sigma factor (sigma-70 family)
MYDGWRGGNVTDADWLAEKFEEKRNYLRAVAYRMLGSQSEADDAVQEAWLRLNRYDPADIHNLKGWLTTTVARVCLDLLRSRKSRREVSIPADLSELTPSREDGTTPEEQALIADSVGLALLVVLDTLAPAERVALVLHDMFDVSFEEIAPIVGRSPLATRQLASRARRRVRGAAPTTELKIAQERKIVGAFLMAARKGDFEALLALLDPDVVLHADRTAVDLSVQRAAHGAPRLMAEIRGAAAVAETFKGRGAEAQLALIDGSVGLVWAPGGNPQVVFHFIHVREKIIDISLIADPERLRQFDITLPAWEAEKTGW